jgi:thiamine-monophosphate kinase
MVSEFEFIKNIKSRYALDKIGDDCAILPKDANSDLLMTADLLIEDIDFRLDWTTPELLGSKALAVSLSDIAAMGGKASSAMLSLGIPASLWESDFLDRFYDGWFAVADDKVELIGGDISRSPDTIIIDSIVLGDVPKGKALLRSTAKPGDRIYVSGALGGAAAGLKLLQAGHRFDPNDPGSVSNLILHQLHVVDALPLANFLIQHDIATSAIDVSDGLSSDLRHICDASGVGARIILDRLPFHGYLADNFPPNECEDLALHGGEDYVLLFTADSDLTSIPDEYMITHIGEITPDTGHVELIRGGRSEELFPAGFRHF